ncbi:hypothetical protein H5187_20020 [Pseudoalteromonas sp. SG44-1]|uniref:hypothetical protein n=1 Tax=Pseudoalteromonas sp. SG44-1 TaxID=2760964 RepID=UPI00160339EC|nr:hypothetical protein [Pseudoalteromonas sp. SG44-1]MBB1419539.1 hypothetical protein [Pseudoalteromonas sp. SG44-1]
MEIDVDFTGFHLAAAKMQGIELSVEEFINFARSVIDGMDKELTSYLELSFNQVVSGEDIKAGSDFNRLIKDYIQQVCR